MKIIDDLISTFPKGEVEQIKSLIEQTKEFEIYPNKSQIWASILVLSDASFAQVIQILPQAKKDWRDVVIASGLAVEKWDQIAMKWILLRGDKSK